LFVDARYPQEYEHIRIKNSINLPVSYSINQIAGRLEKLKKEQMIIVFCTNAECNYSTRVAESCRFLKYSNVFIFRGGIEEWDNKGYPLIKASE
jgi:rhodanese-related sulfurtransferase